MSSIKLHREHGLNPSIKQCFWCEGDTDEIVLLGASYEGEAPRRVVLDYVPCKNCQNMWDQGIVIICVTTAPKVPNHMPLTPKQQVYPTGQWSVVKRDAVEQLVPASLRDDVLRAGKCLMTETEYNMTFPPTPDGEIREHSI